MSRIYSADVTGFRRRTFLNVFKVLGVARRTVRHMLPLRVVLDGVIELRGAPGERQNTGIVRAPAPIRIRIRIQHAVLNLSLNAFPLLFWRLVFHPPNIISVFWAEAPENLCGADFPDPTIEASLSDLSCRKVDPFCDLLPAIPPADQLEHGPNHGAPLALEPFFD